MRAAPSRFSPRTAAARKEGPSLRSTFRPGFTLVEVLLALGLTLLLLGAIYEGIEIYRRTSASGRIEAEQKQISRAVLRMIERDIRCVSFRDPKLDPTETEGSTPASGTSGSAGTSGSSGTGGTSGSGSGSSSGGSASGGSSAGGGSGSRGGSSASSGGSSSSGSGSGSGTSSSSGRSSSGGGSASGGSGTGSSSGGSSAQGANQGSSTRIKIESPEEALTGQSIGVYGDASSLILHTTRPAGGRRTTAGSPSTAPTSDLRSIAYFLATPGGSGLAGMVGQSAAGNSVLSGSAGQSQGLARLEGDRLSVQKADANRDLASLSSETKILAPEINLLQFEYHDGTNWLTVWDSVERGRLPQAIRVTIGFKPAPVKNSPSTTTNFVPTGTSESAGITRLIIALPTTDPGAPLREGT